MSALEGAEAEKGEPEKPKECLCKLKLGICSPFIGFNPSSTKEDPLYHVLPEHFKQNVEKAMKEFDSFPHGGIALPPDHEPYIARKKNPSETKKKSKKTDESKPSSDLAGFYAEDLLYGTVLAEIKKLDDEKAFVMKGYMSSTFISHLRDLANKEAKARGNDLPEELTDIEKLVNLDRKPLDDYIAKKRNGEDVRLNNQFDKFIETHGLEPDVRSKFKFIRDMKNGISDAEVNTLIVLPLRKLLIVIETKARTEETNFPSKLKEGSQQCETFHQYLKAAHWNILSEQWKLVKCVSFPLIFNLEEDTNQEKIKQNCGCCLHCINYIIDGRKLKVMGAWLRNVLDRFPAEHISNHEYTNLITRILGFTMIMKNPSPWSLTLSENRKLNDYQITGSVSGISSDSREPPESWIWLRKGQLEALSCLRVIFSADYGTGKTLLLKRKALELSDMAANQEIGEFGRKVLFISLAALADKYKYATEAKFEEHWRNETILDLCNKLDFDKQVEKKTMKVCGVSDLVEEYEKSGNRATEGLTWTDLVSFILCKEEYKNHHVFIDEIPLYEPGVEKIAESADSDKILEFFRAEWIRELAGDRSGESPASDRGVEKVAESADSDKNGKNVDRHVWMALGTGTMFRSIYEKTFPEWQKRMEAEPYSFVSPKLSYEDLYGHPEKADGPKLHPVIGPQPEYIDAGNLHDILRTTLEKKYPEEEPVVILCGYGNDVSTFFAIMSGDPENQRTVIQYSIFTSMTSDQKLEQRDTLIKYLKQPEGVLVTDIYSFAGMQARNIIVFDSDTLFYPRRNMLLRATTSLVLIGKRTEIEESDNTEDESDSSEDESDSSEDESEDDLNDNQIDSNLPEIE